MLIRGIFKIKNNDFEKSKLYPPSATIEIMSNDKKKSWEVPLARIDRETRGEVEQLGFIWARGTLEIKKVKGMRLHFFKKSKLIKVAKKDFNRNKLKFYAGA